MKRNASAAITLVLATLAWSATAATLCVSLQSTNPVSPYADWNTAATNIQDAVDATTDGDTVLVTNGVYKTGGRMLYNNPPTNRVSVTKTLSLLSVNGAAATSIEGYQMPTGTNGAAAIRCVYLTNGAVLSGFTLTNGATYANPGGGNWDIGGAVYCQTTNPINAPISAAIISRCVLIGNSACFGEVAYGGRLNNCVLELNSGGASYCLLNNCTVVSNSAGFGVHFSTANNCIIYYNLANSWSSSLAYCCTPDSGGTGNITNEPAFVSLVGGDYHLQSNSPCINAGRNAYTSGTTDLDGNPRIVGGTVDIGAYEYQSPSSVLSYAWAQQYGLPTDGSADTADADGDGLNNWQEWIADTNPTNAASVLRLVSVTKAQDNLSGIFVSWMAQSARLYSVERSTNLTAQPAFSTIASNLSQTGLLFYTNDGTNSFADTTATGSGPYFYRVRVQP